MPTDCLVDIIEKNGVQSLVLPVNLHLDAKQVTITRDQNSGNLIISVPAQPDPQLGNWKAFFDFMETVDVPQDYMADRPMNRVPPDRGVFDDER